MIETRSNSKLHETARFLLINAEVVGQKNMTLIYFLFCYSHRYQKQQYANFAFELLEENLSEIVSRTSKRDAYIALDVVENGWGLIQLVGNDFFDSDGLDDILRPYDEVTIHLTEALSRGEFNQSNVYGLLICAYYLNNRIELVDQKSKHYLLIKEHLLITFFELVHNIDCWDKNDMRWTTLMKQLFEKNKRNHAVSNLAIKGLQKLVNIIDLDNEQIINLYTLMRTKDELNQSLLLSSCYSGVIEHISRDNRRLLKDVETKIYTRMENLYKMENHTSFLGMQEIIVYATALLNGTRPFNQMYFTHITNNLIGKEL